MAKKQMGKYEYTLLRGKRALNYICAYSESNACCLSDAYGSYSYYKARAEEEILQEMNEVKGWGYRITGAGNTMFSCGYLIRDDKGNHALVIHTPTYRYLIEL